MWSWGSQKDKVIRKEMTMPKKVRRYKECTLRNYNGRQLLNHLDDLMNASDTPKYRCDIAYGLLHKWSEEHNCYTFVCSDMFTDKIKDIIEKTYEEMGL